MDCEYTIHVLEEEAYKLNPNLKKLVEVKYYKTTIPQFSHKPWECVPKWNIVPRGDVVVGVESDVIIWNTEQAYKYINECYDSKQILGTMAYEDHLEENDWINLFKDRNLQHKANNECQNGKTSPYYVNNAVVMMPNNVLQTFRNSLSKVIYGLADSHGCNKYFAQIATALSIVDSGLPHKASSPLMNYLESHFREPNNSAAFYHYNLSYGKMTNIQEIKQITECALRQKLMSLLVEPMFEMKIL